MRPFLPRCGRGLSGLGVPLPPFSLTGAVNYGQICQQTPYLPTDCVLDWYWDENVNSYSFLLSSLSPNDMNTRKRLPSNIKMMVRRGHFRSYDRWRSHHSISHSHRLRSGWNSGGRMASAEGGSVPSGVGYGRGSPLQPTTGSRERRELPQRVPGHSPGQKRILAYFEGHRTLLFVPTGIWRNLRGTICISVPRTPNSGGTCLPSPSDLRQWP